MKAPSKGDSFFLGLGQLSIQGIGAGKTVAFPSVDCAIATAVYIAFESLIPIEHFEKSGLSGRPCRLITPPSAQATKDQAIALLESAEKILCKFQVALHLGLGFIAKGQRDIVGHFGMSREYIFGHASHINQESIRLPDYPKGLF